MRSGALALLLALAGCPKAGGDEGLVRQLDGEIIALRKRNAALQEQLEHCANPATPPEVYAELVQVYAGTEVTVGRSGPRTIVSIPGGLLFTAGETTVREESAMVVDMLATALKVHPDLHVWVVGHTDDQPLTGNLKRRFGSNWELSAARAADFARVLIDRFGIPAERVTIAGRGPFDPIAENDTPEGRALNRRVVVVIGPPERWR